MKKMQTIFLKNLQNQPTDSMCHYLIVLIFLLGMASITNAQDTRTHDFDDGDFGQYEVNKPDQQSRVYIENGSVETHWQQDLYNGTNSGRKAQFRPINDIIFTQHIWMGLRLKIHSDYMAENTNTNAGLMQIWGYNGASGAANHMCMLKFDGRNGGALVWQHRYNSVANKTHYLIEPNFPRNEFVDIIIHIQLKTRDTGIVQVWVNGELKLNKINQNIGWGEMNENGMINGTHCFGTSLGQYNYHENAAYDDAYDVENHLFDGHMEGETRTVTYDNVSLYNGAEGYDIVNPGTTVSCSNLPDVTPPSIVSSGINYNYYEGNWDILPNFDDLTPVASGTITEIDLNNITATDYFGCLFTGYIDTPTEGSYTFYTTSDDGSALYIDDQLVVDNDGIHGLEEKSGSICLDAGYHDIRVEYFEKTGGNNLMVSYSGPGLSQTTDLPLYNVGNYTSIWTDNDFTISDQTINYNSGTIDISCTSNACILVDIQGVGDMENDDYLNVYYSIDDGTPQAIAENVNAFDQQSLSVCDINGSTVEITVEGTTSHGTEIYHISNLQITGESNAQIDIQIHAYLEGAYDTASSEMTTGLYTRGLLPGQTPTSALSTPTPTGQPYNIAPWNYIGTEGTGWTDDNYAGNEIDWVIVSFRTGTAKNTEVAMTAGMLKKDGSIEFPNRCALTSTVASPVYIVVEHRNHIGVMTPQPVDIINGTLTYDFRLSDSFRDQTSFGQKQLPTGEWVMFAGDADQSDFPSFDIKGTDKTLWFDNNGVFDYYLSPDFNLDGDINGQDKTLWFDNNGISSRVPK